MPKLHNMHPSLTHQTHMQTANALQHLAPSYFNVITVTLLYSYTNICCSLKCYCNSSHSNNKEVAYLYCNATKVRYTNVTSVLSSRQKELRLQGSLSVFNHSSNDHHYNQFLHKQFHLIINSKVQYTPKHPSTDYFICRLFMNMLLLLQVLI